MASKTELKILVWVLILNYPIKLTTALCNRECKKYPTPQKYLELKCKKKKDAMFYLDVRSSKTVNEECSGNPLCSGMQQDVLRVVAEECYWNRTCYIPMNSTFPNILNIDGMCTNVNPDVLEASAMCVRKKKIYKFYAIQSPLTKKEGVIKISDLFPWDYLSNNSYHRVIFSAQTNKKLRVSFMEADLDGSADVLKLGGVNVTAQNKNANFDFPPGDVNMEFNVASTSRRGKGFVLCFYWLSLSRNSSKHACDLVRGVKCAKAKTRGRRRG